MAETVPVPPADLLIDEGNPRISQPNTGQQKVLKALAQHLGPKLHVLAADIIGNGLDPSNVPIVIPFPGSQGRYVVLEGNRRLAAIRALENPETIVDAVSPSILRKIRRLSKDYQSNPVEPITCVVVKDREEARHWIELRHTGENAGAGVVPWGSDESARFRARTGPAEPHSQALDFLQQRGDLTPELRSKVPATSFKRLIDTPVVRDKLGVEVKEGVLFLLAAESKIARALMHVVNDLANRTTKVGQIYTLADRKQYAQRLPVGVVVKATKKSGDGVPATADSHPPPTKAKKTAKTRKRPRLIPRDCALNIQSGRIKNIEDELRKLSLEDHTNAVAVLFRVFIELSIDSYITANTLAISEDTGMQKKMAAVATDLVKRKKLTDKQRKPVSRACQKDSFLAPSVTLMHQYVHNPHVFPAPGDLRAHWDSLQPFFGAIWST